MLFYQYFGLQVCCCCDACSRCAINFSTCFIFSCSVKKIQQSYCNASSPVLCLLVWIFAFCLHHATNSLLSMPYLNIEQMILLVLILVFTSCYLKYIKSLLFCMKTENFCLRAHGKKCLARSIKSGKKSMVSNYLHRKNRGKKTKNNKVTNFKKGLTMLDDAELLINTSKGPDYINVPFASITNKLKKIEKIPYCCLRHLVYLKAQNILFKMAAKRRVLLM